ncbi:ABC transporter permease [Aquimarina algicola]|uniref:FtsX-like permease family protein n=1 Tax=Aquimarina algicola TaxID=2589995 RepID=A0A504JBJ1_9FLAO|nr:ABC transporter permease [Aquimarina algicola]TPN88014.1 FtsX-like permease family protein [Aquimarina algicola]
MFRNYIKIAWRSLLKNRLQTLINLLGLTIGTVCCLSILVYVFAQFGYDKHHDDSESLYKVRTFIKGTGNAGSDANVATSSPPIAFAMKEDFPEVLEACRVVYFGEGNDALLRDKNSTNSYYESKGYLADPTFFEVFKYSFTQGDAKKALEEPNTIVLSSTLAQKLFGAEKALGKTLVLGSGEDKFDVTVTGVFQERTYKSHINPNYILSMNSPGVGEFVKNVTNFATQNFAHTYIRVLPGTDYKKLEQKLPEFLQKRGGQNLAAVGFDKSLFLQKVGDIHLYSKGIENQLEEVSNIQYLYLLLILALVIQIAACINFINLSTARANKRAKEIGVRKVVGANKASLIRQFLGESVLLSIISLIISIPITVLVLPFVNILTKGDAIYADIFHLNILLPMFLLSVISGLLAGIYPALILSSVRPAHVLKGIMNVSSGSGNFRKGLVVFQFVISIVLIVAVIIINKQIEYTKNKDLGFKKENLIAIRLGTDEAIKKFDALRSQISGISGITSLAGSNQYPSENILGDLGLHLPGEDPTKQKIVVYNGISDNYFKTVGTKLAIGRDLRVGDSTQVIVNKATLKAFNIDLKNALASRLIQTYEDRTYTYEIVGVVEDYHFSSLKEVIAPIILFNENEPDWLLVKTNTTDFASLLSNLKQAWTSVNSHIPFVYTFVDKEVEKLYAEEQRLSQISIVFTGLAILISCLGLFGLISFMAEQRKKEIGIRKVLGASVATIINMFAKDFIKLVIIALVIATPIAYYYLENWLEGFAYRTSINWWVFILAGGVTIVITFVTIFVQTFRAATINPTKNLRAE